MTLIELKKGLLSQMQTIFPTDEYNYYSMAVIENYARPCFFTKIEPTEMSELNYNSRDNQVEFTIDYEQESVDEADMLEKAQKIRDLLGLSIKIGDRYVKVEGYDYDFVGAQQNILEITADLRWIDQITHSDTSETMSSLETNISIKTED